MKYIKTLNEFFDTGAFGDTYGDGGGNGIFKISYKPFKDLGLEVGPDKDVKRNVSGSEFAVGDIVIGVPVDKEKKKVGGMIVKAIRNTDNKSYRYFVQTSSKKLKDGEKVVELKADTVIFADMGNKGHIEAIKGLQIPAKSTNSDTVYTASDLGVETVGG